MKTYRHQILVDRIDAAAVRAGRKLPQMLAEAEMSDHVLKNIKRGRAPSAETLYAVAAALGCSADWLLGLTDEPSLADKTWAPLMRQAIVATLKAYRKARGGLLLDGDMETLADGALHVFDAARSLEIETARAAIDTAAGTVIPFALRDAPTRGPADPAAPTARPADSGD